MDFSGTAGAATQNDLIPAGQLAHAILTVRSVKNSVTGGRYIDVELTIDEGQPYGRKKLWDMIGDPTFSGNSDKYREMGMIAITRILECGKGAGPNNKGGYVVNDTKTWAELNGLRVAIKIGVETGTNGHPDKNRISDYLTPNPASQSGHKALQTLLSGVFNTTAPKPAAAAAQTGFGGFGGSDTKPAATGGGFGQQQAQQQKPAASGFGNGGGAAAGSGFQEPAGNAAASAAEAQSRQAAGGSGFASTKTATDQFPSDPGKTPNWLEQANQ